MKNIIYTIKNLTIRLFGRVKPKALLIIVMASILVSIAFSGIANAQMSTYKSNVCFNKDSIDFLTVSNKQVEIKPGLAKVDIDKLNNERDPEAIKAYIQQLGEEYGIDWKLVYAIGAYESGYFKSYLAQENNNFFGRKATSTTWMQWNTPEEGIRNQFEYLKNRYINRGMDTPAEMNSVYCEGNTWQYKVQYIMDNA